MVNFSYNRIRTQEGINIEIVIRDESMSKIEVFRCKGNDFYKIANILYKKYGIRYKPEISHPFGIKKPKDLEWDKKNTNI